MKRNIVSCSQSDQNPLEFQINSIEHSLMLNYLYRIYIKKINSTGIKVLEFLGISNLSMPAPKIPSVYFTEDTYQYEFNDQIIFLTVIFYGKAYKITFAKIQESYDEVLRVNYLAYINPVSVVAHGIDKLLNFIRQESIKNSSFRNKTISYSVKKGSFLSCLKIVNVPDVSLDTIFIPQSKLNQLKRFVNSVEKYDVTATNLRYLLSGAPGTGKTKIIQAITTSLKNKATILIVNSDFIPFKQLIEFCSVFDKAVLIIDDIDFIAANRDENLNRGELNVFMQTLDGFIPNHVFLIGSTNDKRLIDSAAGRPGRFDMILDINEIDPQNYLSLVARETDDPQIVSFFDSGFLEEMKIKKVTGAYIVSLIKQLKNMKSNGEILDARKFKEIYSLTHKGFYTNNSREYDLAVGFNN